MNVCLMLFGDMSYYSPRMCVFLVLCTCAHALHSQRAPNPSNESMSTFEKRLEDVFHETVVKRLDAPYLQLPIFQHSRTALVDKRRFSPARGSGRERLPDDARNLLAPPVAAPATPRRDGRARPISVACHLRKMIVKVNKQILGPDEFRAELKLGSCDVSRTTKKHHVFVYDMHQCGSERKLVNNRITYSNILHYSPVMPAGPVRHAAPFSVHTECHYNRYHYSYKIGFTPQVEFQNYFRALKTVDSVVLTPRDALWRRLPPTEAYTIGHPMYFQADGPPLADDERLYVDSCYVTVNSSHLSKPRFTVIENHGCMTDSKSSRWSRFIQSGQRNIVQFSLDAFLFHGMLGKDLYMHCEISVGSVNPTPSSKLCTYNQETKRWEELHGTNSVCVCCDSRCLASDLSVTSKMISSEVWSMESDLNIIEEEQPTSSFMLSEVNTGEIQIETTPAPDVGPHPYVTGLGVVEFVEPRRIFEEVFGLD